MSVRVFLWVVFVVSCAVASPATPANTNNAISPVTILSFIISLQESRELSSQAGCYDLCTMRDWSNLHTFASIFSLPAKASTHFRAGQCERCCSDLLTLTY